MDPSPKELLEDVKRQAAAACDRGEHRKGQPFADDPYVAEPDDGRARPPKSIEEILGSIKGYRAEDDDCVMVSANDPDPSADTRVGKADTQPIDVILASTNNEPATTSPAGPTTEPGDSGNQAISDIEGDSRQHEPESRQHDLASAETVVLEDIVIKSERKDSANVVEQPLEPGEVAGAATIDKNPDHDQQNQVVVPGKRVTEPELVSVPSEEAEWDSSSHVPRFQDVYQQPGASITCVRFASAPTDDAEEFPCADIREYLGTPEEIPVPIRGGFEVDPEFYDFEMFDGSDDVTTVNLANRTPLTPGNSDPGREAADSVAMSRENETFEPPCELGVEDHCILAAPGDIIQVNGDDGYGHIDLACFSICDASFKQNRIQIKCSDGTSFQIEYQNISRAVFANGVEVDLQSGSSTV